MPLFDEIDILLFLEILGIVLFVNYFLFRKLLMAFVDPIWFMVIINTTVTLTLVIYDRVRNDDLFSGTMLYVCCAHLCFIIGARITRQVVLLGMTPAYMSQARVNTGDTRTAAGLLKMSTVLLLFMAVYYLVTGVPAFASDPELARVLAKKGGGGLVARLYNVFAYLSLTLWFYCRLKKIRLGLAWSALGLAVPLFLLLFVGAKASLLFVYISFFYVSYYVAHEAGIKFIFPVKYFFITAGVVLCVSFVLLFARAGEAGASTSSWEFASFQLLGRIAFSGVGAAHYFSTYVPALDDLNLLDYLYHYVALPLLAPLRVFEYEQTVGSILAVSITGDDTFGPNPSMYAEGAIYFGRIFGAVYCGVLGVIFSLFRYLPLRMQQLPDYFRVIIFSFGNMLIMSMTYDMVLFVGDLINFVFFVLIGLVGVVLVRASMRAVPPAANLEKS